MGAIGFRKSDKQPNCVPPAVVDATLKLWQEGLHRHWFSTAGASMIPLIQDGDRVHVIHKVDRLQRGDIVVFRRGDRVIAHRVIRICYHANGQILLTKGDNALQFDEPVEVDSIIGKVTALQREGHHVRLDTLQWQMLGWLIAAATGVAATTYERTRSAKRSLMGPAPVPFAGGLKRLAAMVLVRMIGLAQVNGPKHS